MKKVLCFLMALVCLLCMAACAPVVESDGGGKPNIDLGDNNGGDNGDNSGDNNGDNNGDDPEPPVDNYTEPEYDMFYVSEDATVLNLQCTDSLGRYFTASESFDSDKKVGVFYFLWNGQNSGGKVYDSSKLTETELKTDRTSAGRFHYWNEPLYGYYDSGDPWVFGKHLEMLIMAGIDYLVFDVSNGYAYADVCEKIFPVAIDYVNQGWSIPRFIFYCHNKTKDTVTEIYNKFYDPENNALRKYDPLWYRETDNGERNTDNKPWLVVKNNGVGTDPDNNMNSLQNFSACDEKIKDFFYTRELKWNAEHEDGGEWLFPSDIDDPVVHKGMLSVSVAQHTSGAFSDSVYETGKRDSNRGRGWNGTTNVDRNVNLGTNYQGEWDKALSLGDVNNVFLSTWNEWVAQKQLPEWGGRGTCYFVDQFNAEFSRDLEPVRGLWGDAYYLQTALNARIFKEVSTDKSFTPRQSAVDITKDDSKWLYTVGFCDPAGDVSPRNYKSANSSGGGNVPTTTYKNNTGRNDIVKTNVTCDDKNLYFRIECADDIEAYTAGDATWMNILVEVDGMRGSNWENYHFVVNRTVSGSRTGVERLSKDGSSDMVGFGEFNLSGKVLTVKVPREHLELGEHFTINFKVADHVTAYTDIMDYYVNGDSAPIGRLNYTFGV